MSLRRPHRYPTDKVRYLQARGQSWQRVLGRLAVMAARRHLLAEPSQHATSGREDSHMRQPGKGCFGSYMLVLQIGDRTDKAPARHRRGVSLPASTVVIEHSHCRLFFRLPQQSVIAGLCFQPAVGNGLSRDCCVHGAASLRDLGTSKRLICPERYTVNISSVRIVPRWRNPPAP